MATNAVVKLPINKKSQNERLADALFQHVKQYLDSREQAWLNKSIKHTHKVHPELLDALGIMNGEVEQQIERVDKLERKLDALEIMQTELDIQRERADKLAREVDILAQRLSLYETSN